VSWLRCQKIADLLYIVLGSVVIQVYAGECTLSVYRALQGAGPLALFKFLGQVLSKSAIL